MKWRQEIKYHSADLVLCVVFCQVFTEISESQWNIVIEFSTVKPTSQLYIIPSNLCYLVLVKISLFQVQAA